MTEPVEKIEIAKNTGNYFYTGILEELDEGWVRILTTRGEKLKFRKDQVMQREAVQ